MEVLVYGGNGDLGNLFKYPDDLQLGPPMSAAAEPADSGPSYGVRASSQLR